MSKMLDRVANAIDAERRCWSLEEMSGIWFAVRRTSPDEGSKWDLGPDKEIAEAKFAPAVNDALATAAIGAMRNASRAMIDAFHFAEDHCEGPNITDPDPAVAKKIFRWGATSQGWSAAIDIAMSGRDREVAN